MGRRTVWSTLVVLTVVAAMLFGAPALVGADGVETTAEETVEATAEEAAEPTSEEPTEVTTEETAEITPEETFEATPDQAAEAGPEETADDVERAQKLERWDELQRERIALKRQLAEVQRELRALSRELWSKRGPWMGREKDVPVPEWLRPEEWERAAEDWERWRDEWREHADRFWERVGERLGALGEDVLPWVPEAVVEGLAERTGFTPDEVRELIRSGQWDVLIPRRAAEDGETPGEEASGSDEPVEHES